MKPGVRVVRDNSAAVLASIQAMAKRVVVVGVTQEKDIRKADGTYKGPIGNAGLAYVHETGSPRANVPARPFLKPGVAAAGPQAAKALGQAAGASFTDKGALDRGLNAAGLIAQASVKKTIVAGEGFEPLAESTIRARQRRGIESEKPLIRTGQLVGSITYAVRDRT